MRSRSTLLFLLLVAVPLGLIAWVGVLMLRQQDEQARLAWQAMVDQQLDAAAGTLDQEIRRLEEGFDGLLRQTAPEEAALHELPRNQPFIRHAFLLDARGKLLFPSPEATQQGESLSFLRRTAPVWESGIHLGRVDSEEIPPTKPSGGTYLRRADTRPQLATGDTADVVSSGWHVWFYGSGPQLLFWQQRSDGRTLGLEVEMAAFLSLLINRLSDPSPGLLRLMDSDGKTVLHQNAGRTDAIKPAARLACPQPLGMWHLEYFPAANEGPQSNRAPVWLGVGAAVLALIVIAWLFHRESTRDQREARRRVTFVNQVSHELKTPLTNIRLYTEMAIARLPDDIAAETSRHLAVVEAETSRLSRLIHNVLTFGRQQREQLAIHRRAAVLDEVVNRVVATWRPGLEAVGFHVECETNAPRKFDFDADALEQILGNLLSNVEKYAADGQYVRIATGTSADSAWLSVEDRGRGIPRRRREEIFSAFVRIRDDLTEGVSGTGIGLTIARQLAELHDGNLIVETAEPGGAKFILQLPNPSS